MSATSYQSDLDCYTGLSKKNAGVLAVSGYALFTMYIWCLPLLARYFNYNNDDSVCSLSDVICTDATTEIKGCGCGEGVFGQSACPVGSFGFTISGFIATAPGTGMMAVFSIIPIVSMYFYGTGSSRAKLACDDGLGEKAPTCLRVIARGSLVLFTIFYVIFIGGTYCIFPVVHEVSVLLFVLFGIMHYGVIVYLHIFVRHVHASGSVILCMALIVVTGFSSLIISGYVYAEYDKKDWAYIPWLSECVAMTAGFGIAPIMIWYEIWYERNVIPATTI